MFDGFLCSARLWTRKDIGFVISVKKYMEYSGHEAFFPIFDFDSKTIVRDAG